MNMDFDPTTKTQLMPLIQRLIKHNNSATNVITFDLPGQPTFMEILIINNVCNYSAVFHFSEKSN